MKRSPAWLGRRTGTILLTIVVLCAGCGLAGRDLEPGSYRAVLELPGGELPFGLDVAREETGLVIYLVNGDERTRIDSVTVADGRLTAALPRAPDSLTARLGSGTLSGEVTLRRGTTQVLPFAAELGEPWRFFAEALTDNADVSGRWAVTFTGQDGSTAEGVADLTQSFEAVTGRFSLPGNQGGLVAGEVHGEDLRLSRFDGVTATLFHARLDADGRLVGEYWSGDGTRQRFVGVHEPGAPIAP